MIKLLKCSTPGFRALRTSQFSRHTPLRAFSTTRMAFDLAGPEPELAPASSPATAETVKYLKGFTALGEQIFYYKPESEQSTKDSGKDYPELVILCSWLYALPKHIAKYTAAYQRIYPQSPILLLKQDGPDMMWRPNSWQMQNMRPAINSIEAARSDDAPPKVLLHVFSNGGAFTACQLADSIKVNSTSGGNIKSLPITALVIDSAPSIPSLAKGRVALSQGLPASLPGPVRAVGGLALWTTMMALSLASRMLGAEGTMTGMRRKLNDPDGPFVAADLTRVYIYSKTDELVPWEQVEDHALEAMAVYENKFDNAASRRVQFEEFEGSKHVAHAVVDAKRYWGIVQDLWSRSVA